MGTIKSETQSFTWCMHLLPFYLMESKAAAHQLWTSTNSGRYMGSGISSGREQQRQPP
jgi:dolichyl-phosphate-mannose--protein O-mannosyl transferase